MTEDNHHFDTHEIKLQHDDTLYICTDGYADQFGGPKGKKFKYKALNEMLVSLVNEPMQYQKQILEKTIENWKGDLEQVDDILIIGLNL